MSGVRRRTRRRNTSIDSDTTDQNWSSNNGDTVTGSNNSDHINGLKPDINENELYSGVRRRTRRRNTSKPDINENELYSEVRRRTRRRNIAFKYACCEISLF